MQHTSSQLEITQRRGFFKHDYRQTTLLQSSTLVWWHGWHSGRTSAGKLSVLRSTCIWRVTS